MIYKSEDSERRSVFAVADKMITAAKTAPKGCGEDNIVSVILDGNDKDILSAHMRDIAAEFNADFFNRDALCVDKSHCVVLIGVVNKPLGLESCSMCGFKNCGEMQKAGTNCAFNITDLGIAVGSAVSIAADNRIDNRVFFSAGQAALRMDCFPSSVRVCFGIPLSTTSKSVFFDRDPGTVTAK